MKISFIKENICKIDNITLDEFELIIHKFEKSIKSSIKKYEDTTGLEDYKMKKDDYSVLYNLYKSTQYCPNKLNILLYFMYSYYKLDGFDYNKKKFPFKQFFTFIEINNNVHKIILDSIIELS